MKITKYPQSCLMVETRKTKILVDPGTIDYDEKFLEEWSTADAVLITHKHSGHFNIEALKKLKGIGDNVSQSVSQGGIKGKNAETGPKPAKFVPKDIPIYSNSEVAEMEPELEIKLVNAGDEFQIGDFGIEVTPAVHGYNPILKGVTLKENVGFLIDDARTVLYVTSDCLAFDNDIKCNVIAAPASGMGLTMDALTLGLYAKQVNAKYIVVTHMDNKMNPVTREAADAVLSRQDIKYFIPKTGETLELFGIEIK